MILRWHIIYKATVILSNSQVIRDLKENKALKAFASSEAFHFGKELET